MKDKIDIKELIGKFEDMKEIVGTIVSVAMD